MENKIKQFVIDNKLDFSGEGSELNSNCVTICGYALYLGCDSYGIVDDVVEDVLGQTTPLDTAAEIERVFRYAEDNNYGEWWKHPDAHSMYKF